MRPRAAIRWPAAALAAVLFWGGAGTGARAEDATTFLGTGIESAHARYVVTKDVNVRAEPKTTAKRVDTLTRGTRVRAVGMAKDDKGWLAVLNKDGEPLGFVYGEMMLELIDGTLTEQLRGDVETEHGGLCLYRIRFDGKSPVEDDLFEVADYTVRFACGDEDNPLRFSTPMFLTEAPYRMGAKPEYQITLDIVEISEGYDQVFSSTSIYRGDDRTVRFDGTTIPAFADKGDKTPRPVSSIAEALKVAVELAVGAWNEKVWSTLKKAAN